MPQPSRVSLQRILLSVPHLSGKESRYVQEALHTGWVSTVGPSVSALEQEFSTLAKLPTLALSSGTAAIHLGLRLFRLRPDDEVICPTLTFVASCNPILYEGCKPVFADSDRESWNIDPQRLSDTLGQRARSNKLPKAVIVVHLFGLSADIGNILEICRRYEIPVLEDAAEALGATHKGELVGTFGDVGAFSLNGNKVITSGGGGLLVSPRKDWVDNARHWSQQACDPSSDGNYLHSQTGYNYRMSNVLAGIARGQLEVLHERVEARRAISFRYRDALLDVPGLEFMPQPADARHLNWLSCFLIDEALFGCDQAALIRFLDTANVETRPVWKPMHTQKLFERYECVGGEVAEDLNRRGICLPSSSSLSQEDQQFVIDRIREAHLRATGKW